MGLVLASLPVGQERQRDVAYCLDGCKHCVSRSRERLPGGVAHDVYPLALGVRGGRKGRVADSGALAPEPSGGGHARDEPEPLGVGAGTC